MRVVSCSKNKITLGMKPKDRDSKERVPQGKERPEREGPRKESYQQEKEHHPQRNQRMALSSSSSPSPVGGHPSPGGSPFPFGASTSSGGLPSSFTPVTRKQHDHSQRKGHQRGKEDTTHKRKGEAAAKGIPPTREGEEG